MALHKYTRTGTARGCCGCMHCVVHAAHVVGFAAAVRVLCTHSLPAEAAAASALGHWRLLCYVVGVGL
jgi:hypothetical protein